MFRFAKVLLAGTVAFGGIAIAQAQRPTVYPVKASYGQQAAIPFDLFRGSRIFFTGAVNGQQTAMMLDSGAGMTVLDDDYAAKLGLPEGEKIEVEGASGSVPGRQLRGLTLTVGGLTLTDLSVMVIDLDPVARAIGRPIPVVLGRDAMKAGLVTIDFPGRRIGFASRNGFEPAAGSTRIELGEDTHLRSVPVSVGGAPIQATLDIGNPGTLLLANSYWKGKPEFASLRYAETQTGGVGGVKTARKVVLPEVTFAGQRLTDVPAILNMDPTALPTEGGNLGIEMLKPFVVTIDDTGGTMYLTATGRTHDFRRERAGVHTELAGDRLKVKYVSPDGPAAAAGLKAGDEIVAIDGKNIGSDYYNREEWTRGAAGKKVRLQRADGSAVLVTLADYY